MTVTVFTPEPVGYDRPKEVARMASDITDAGYTFHRIAGVNSRVIFEVHGADGTVHATEIGKLDHNEPDVLDRLILGSWALIRGSWQRHDDRP